MASGGPAQVGTALATSAVPGFKHLHAGHCESGVTASMFQNAGAPVQSTLSEPMIFGIGGGLFFAHFSFVRVMGHPLTTFRSFPGGIFSNACKRLGVACAKETFRSPDVGMRRLDQLLAEGKRVGLQVNIFWLPYIPRPMRVHFNGHNLLVIERREAPAGSPEHARGDAIYIVSDPVMECLFECPASDLRRARFSGTHALLPRGLLYYPTAFTPAPDLRAAVDTSLRKVCQHMLRIPSIFPWMGVQGVRHLGREIEGWPARLGEQQSREWLAGVVRMQEEIGTGGAGFRFIFAAYLQQAGDLLGWPELSAMALPATAVGDQWRTFALHASRLARGKVGGLDSVPWSGLRPMLDDIAAAETALLTQLDGVRVGRRGLSTGPSAGP